MVDHLIHGSPRSKGENPSLSPQAENGPKPKVVAYLSDVFEAPRLRDEMKQYDLVLQNLSKQKSFNEESCKRDMKYHRQRYERIYDDVRASPQSLPPLKGVTSPPWPATPSSEHPPNSDIYIDTKRGKPGDNVLFKADWRVVRTEFPPKSGYNSAVRRQQQMLRRSGKSGRSRDVSISWNNPTPDVEDDKQRSRTFIAPGGYFEGSVNHDYGNMIKSPNLDSIYSTPRRGLPNHDYGNMIKSPNLDSIYSTPRRSPPPNHDYGNMIKSPNLDSIYSTPRRGPPPNHDYGNMVKSPNLDSIYATPRRAPPPIQDIPGISGMSERRYKPPPIEDWKTEAWRRANQEYRRYREATNLSGVPVNRRISNFEFGGSIIIG